MKITIEQTNVITEIDGQGARLWRGITERGHRVEVFVKRVVAIDDGAKAELARSLVIKPIPLELRTLLAMARDDEI